MASGGGGGGGGARVMISAQKSETLAVGPSSPHLSLLSPSLRSLEQGEKDRKKEGGRGGTKKVCVVIAPKNWRN